MKDDEKAKEAMQGLAAMMNMIEKMAGQGGTGADGAMPMPSDIKMPTEEETENMFKELMKMQFEMNDESDSAKEKEKQETSTKHDESSLSQQPQEKETIS